MTVPLGLDLVPLERDPVKLAGYIDAETRPLRVRCSPVTEIRGVSLDGVSLVAKKGSRAIPIPIARTPEAERRFVRSVRLAAFFLANIRRAVR